MKRARKRTICDQGSRVTSRGKCAAEYATFASVKFFEKVITSDAAEQNIIT